MLLTIMSPYVLLLKSVTLVSYETNLYNKVTKQTCYLGMYPALLLSTLIVINSLILVNNTIWLSYHKVDVTRVSTNSPN